jgi:hypothetical protein
VAARAVVATCTVWQFETIRDELSASCCIYMNIVCIVYGADGPRTSCGKTALALVEYSMMEMVLMRGQQQPVLCLQLLLCIRGMYITVITGTCTLITASCDSQLVALNAAVAVTPLCNPSRVLHLPSNRLGGNEAGIINILSRKSRLHTFLRWWADVPKTLHVVTSCFQRVARRCQLKEGTLHSDLTTMDVCCAAGAPVSVDYTPTGSFEEVGGVPVYSTGSGSKAIIAVYDIFGFKYPQVRHGTTQTVQHRDARLRSTTSSSSSSSSIVCDKALHGASILERAQQQGGGASYAFSCVWCMCCAVCAVPASVRPTGSSCWLCDCCTRRLQGPAMDPRQVSTTSCISRYGSIYKWLLVKQEQPGKATYFKQ